MFDQKRLLTLAGLDGEAKNNLLTENKSKYPLCKQDHSKFIAGADDCLCQSDNAANRKKAHDKTNEATSNDADALEQLDEIRVRNLIRNEIRSMLNTMSPDDQRNWVLNGQKKSSNSRPGQVSRGFAGPGFVK